MLDPERKEILMNKFGKSYNNLLKVQIKASVVSDYLNISAMSANGQLKYTVERGQN